MTTTSRGRRLPDGLTADHIAPAMAPGDYWKDDKGTWWVRPPRGDVGVITTGPDGWTVTEHEDGTITVSPSILLHGEVSWHGYLERGVWREA